ncbi:proliferating cell nuclear antigen (pcna) [archaeon]|nr:proliferating cell nuclear antigen (pcna) [archaeon]
MKLTLTEPRFLKEPIAIISELVTDVKFKVNKDKIELVAMDPANVAMINFKLLASAFVEYDVEDDKTIGINLEHFRNVLRRAKPTDTVTLVLDEEKNRLTIQLKGESTRTFRLALIDIEDTGQKVPELKFPLTIETSTMLFDEAVEDMDIVSESILFSVDNQKFYIKASGTTNNASIEITTDDETTITTEGDAKIESRYSIEYLKKLIRISRLTDTVVVKFNNDYPLMLEYNVLNKLQFRVILAPRVAND